MKIIMGADPAGFELKNAIKEDLLKRGYEIMDIDPDEPVLFQEAAKAVVSFENAVKMHEAGADIYVAGTSSVFARTGTLEENLKKLRQIIGE